MGLAKIEEHRQMYAAALSEAEFPPNRRNSSKSGGAIPQMEYAKWLINYRFARHTYRTA
jgi:hypothetical protein